MSQHSFFKHRKKSILVWPASCLAIILIFWLTAAIKIQWLEEEAQRSAFDHAASLSTAYSEQLERTIREIESVTLNVKYHWEHNPEDLDLQDQFNKGLYPPTSQLYVSLLNKRGDAIASTLLGPRTNSADREFFRYHLLNADRFLHVSPAVISGKRSSRPVIHFSRRLEDKAGNFDGIVLVSVDPAYLATFNDQKSLNPHDFISIRHEDGTLLVSEKGEALQGETHISPPDFENDIGVMRLSGEHYKDDEARILAWKKLVGYPLVSYVGLSESDFFADHQATVASYKQMALVGTILLCIIAALGMYFSNRLGRRKQQVEEAKQNYLLAVDHAREGFYTMKALYNKDSKLEDFLFEDCNERGAQFLGLHKQELVGSRLSTLKVGSNVSFQPSLFEAAMKAGFIEDEIQLQMSVSDSPIWYQRRLIRSQAGLAVTLRDITESKEHEERLITTANTDALTLLPNRYWFLNYLPVVLKHAAKNQKKIAVLFIDLDRFKEVNDSLGHQAGDQLLRQVAQRLKMLFRVEDTVVRLGGDEFTVLLSSFETCEEVGLIASRIASSFEQEFEIDGKRLVVGASVGISLFPRDGIEPDILVQKADIAMYAAKADVKTNYRFFDQAIFDGIKHRLDSEEELRSAIKSKHFELHYQPRINTVSGELVGFEALVRWQHPKRGLIGPADFISLAEKTGSIVALGALIVEKTCMQIRQWQEEGLTGVPVSINVSLLQLEAGDVDLLMGSTIAKYKLEPSALEIELTESTMMDASPVITDQINSIRSLGIKIHIDDFGTGYSSLSRLQEVRSQVLKIDKAFLTNLKTNEETKILIKAIIQMAHALGMTVIAEGVESIEQLEILQSLECDEIQGYLVSKPLPPDQIMQLMRLRFWDVNNGWVSEQIPSEMLTHY